MLPGSARFTSALCFLALYAAPVPSAARLCTVHRCPLLPGGLCTLHQCPLLPSSAWFTLLPGSVWCTGALCCQALHGAPVPSAAWRTLYGAPVPFAARLRTVHRCTLLPGSVHCTCAICCQALHGAPVSSAAWRALHGLLVLSAARRAL
ncbi:hypothetical protein NDU88_000004 [Pleurodeles waltl]|uniref:Secreted protein n=1 Tax=Pleurodeles waltl TaxID=8319 RepID=A0AAV7L563_PLEWA|nr:hypothetical protein NDU88_000004 [Pleurodeles waltl]